MVCRVLTVLDQRSESVDLNKKNILTYVSVDLEQYLCIHVCDGMHACTWNMELPSADYTNIEGCCAGFSGRSDSDSVVDALNVSM